MPTFERKTMCSECPFRQKAPAGWLGPYTIKDIEEMIQYDQGLVCHVSVKELSDEGLDETEIEEAGQHCVGMLRYMSNMCRLSRDPATIQAQRALKEVKDQAVIPPWKFREHHEQGPNIHAKKKKKR